MINRRVFTEFDYFLFGVTLTLAFLGVLGVYSASAHGGGDVFIRQLIWVGLGVVICFLALFVDYHFLTQHALFLYALAVVVLIAILFLGTEINGSKSWIRIAGFYFQPSEAVKLVLILALTHLLSESSDNFLDTKRFMGLGLLAMAPVVLVTLQGDLGTALMYLPILMGIMIVSGLRMKVVLVLLLVALFIAPLGWFFLKDYQQQRILATFDPAIDPQGIGYQTRQSQIAIGSGGVLGKGLGNGTQSQLGFVPEIHTDFIFALLAEETGFLGAGVILVLYLLLLWRLVNIAEQARDRTGILIITGIASLIFFHVVVNVGMALGVLPPIGIPLPLLSYGGSSTLTIFAALGLALNVYYRRFVY